MRGIVANKTRSVFAAPNAIFNASDRALKTVVLDSGL